MEDKEKKVMGSEPWKGETKQEPPKEQKVMGESAKPTETPEYKKAAKERKERADQLLKDCQAVLKEYGGLESNVPVNHDYWRWLNEYRGLTKEPVEGGT